MVVRLERGRVRPGSSLRIASTGTSLHAETALGRQRARQVFLKLDGVDVHSRILPFTYATQIARPCEGRRRNTPPGTARFPCTDVFDLVFKIVHKEERNADLVVRIMDLGVDVFQHGDQAKHVKAGVGMLLFEHLVVRFQPNEGESPSQGVIYGAIKRSAVFMVPMMRTFSGMRNRLPPDKATDSVPVLQ